MLHHVQQRRLGLPLSRFLQTITLFGCLAFSCSPISASDTETCSARYNDQVGRCALEAQKTAPEGDHTYFTRCGAKYEEEYQRCLRGGGGASQAPPAPPGCEEAKENVDWVFRDAGAKNRYLGGRSAGKSAFDSVYAAQAHNPAAQRTLLDCQQWVIDYLGRGGAPGGNPPDDPPPGDADCSCASVIPVGGRRFQVRNSCPPMKMSVRFVDAMNDTRSAWVAAGQVSPAMSKTITAPEYELPSISAVSLRTSTTSIVCRF